MATENQECGHCMGFCFNQCKSCCLCGAQEIVFKTGEDIELEWDGVWLRGKVKLASPNGRSLAVTNFAAEGSIIEAVMGPLLLLQGDDGVFRNLFNRPPASVAPALRQAARLSLMQRA